ncbi:MAG: hypothetical protein IKR33_01115 [Bacteroidales bacterium]|nr:hypothetical protein [Bacteroidales bacterium]
MKKILLAVCAFAVVSLVGCKKDPVEPDPQNATSGEGIYNPGAHIATATTDGETQRWYWEGSKLNRIETTDVEGNAQGVQQFAYNGNRIASVTQTVEGVATETRVSYSGSYISAITLFTDGHQSANATVGHNSSNKINRIDLDVDASYVTTLLGDLIGNMGMKDGSKFTLNNADIYATLDWQGDNVSRMIIHADINAAISMQEISQIVDLTEVLGEMASLLGLIQGEQPLTLSLVDTIDYTYDQHPNPLQGMIGLLDPSVLSANNPTLMDNHGMADVNLTLNVPLVGQYPIERSVPINRVTDIIYTYNNAGYPLTVSQDEGGTTTYTYND